MPANTWTRLVGLLVLVALTPPEYLSAQQRSANHARATSDWGALDGNIVDTTGTALVCVQIVPLDAPGLAVRSGAGGGFRIDSLPAGPHLVRFRRVGLAPITVPVTIQPHDVVSADVVLGPLATQLKSVVIQGKNGELEHLPFGVADRVRNGFGYYITSADIEREHAAETADLLRRIPGVEVRGLPGQEVVSSLRGTSAMWDKVDAKGNHTVGANCGSGVAVYVDGAPMGDFSVDAVQPSEIKLIEVYKDAVEIPATLPQSACGSVLIWTK